MIYVLPVAFQPRVETFFVCATQLYDLKRDILLKKNIDEQRKDGLTRKNGTIGRKRYKFLYYLKYQIVIDQITI